MTASGEAGSALESGMTFNPRFNADGLIPAIAVDAATGAVLMMAWMNAEALALTLASGAVHYYSRSRRALWRKGETSGHTQQLIDMRIDCDQDTLLLTVDQQGPACHTGAANCFYRTVIDDTTLRPVDAAVDAPFNA